MAHRMGIPKIIVESDSKITMDHLSRFTRPKGQYNNIITRCLDAMAKFGHIGIGIMHVYREQNRLCTG